MSLTRLLGVRGTVYSFIEMNLFFLVLTPAYFFLTSVICLAVPHEVPRASGFSPSSLADWVGAVLTAGVTDLPIWLVLILACGYFLLIIFYWVPGADQDNTVELRGFAAFLLFLLVFSGVYCELRWHGVSDLIQLLREGFFAGHS